ncbi:DUF4382 domain-containing protein [Natronoflexus pectinivorans]|uniref:Uncharacterized protein DUF4382 n=1 Tax=Natronoflexus pectinivorans TaxID=682526 RepID=A0A4R2GGF0_9BACT|nr:DUF4382 domain-containing protein [Natronoflexus pectinivorans]TCO07046.1 uncharacterized protein DUF4382 [Natronoflexus pectinivorans]
MRRLFYFSVIALSLLFYGACNETEKGTGTLNLSITDAPIDTEDITGVYITINEIQYHKSGNNWATFEEFEGPKTYNLLDLTRGESDLLGSFELSSGTYSQIRFILDLPDHNHGFPTNPGCYLEFGDGSVEPLFVPSGGQTGYKAVGAFHVPLNGSVDITADFDVRKSVVVAGKTGRYILKPTIRLVADNQAGAIKGDVFNQADDKSVVVFAYQSGAFNDDELLIPDEESPRFPNAVSSDLVDENGHYHIAFLAPGSYDLVVVITNGEDESEVAGIIEDVIVESREKTTVDIDFEDFE